MGRRSFATWRIKAVSGRAFLFRWRSKETQLRYDLRRGFWLKQEVHGTLKLRGEASGRFQRESRRELGALGSLQTGLWNFLFELGMKTEGKQ